MTYFLLSVHNDDTPVYPTLEAQERAFAATGDVNDAMHDAGVFVFGGGLAASTTARVVRVRDGALQRVDGPYLEAKEHIGGFWVLDVADEAEAIAWAERATVACEGDVEVREFQGIA